MRSGPVPVAPTAQEEPPTAKTTIKITMKFNSELQDVEGHRRPPQQCVSASQQNPSIGAWTTHPLYIYKPGSPRGVNLLLLLQTNNYYHDNRGIDRIRLAPPSTMRTLLTQYKAPVTV